MRETLTVGRIRGVLVVAFGTTQVETAGEAETLAFVLAVGEAQEAMEGEAATEARVAAVGETHVETEEVAATLELPVASRAPMSSPPD